MENKADPATQPTKSDLQEPGDLYRQMFAEHPAIKLIIDPDSGRIVEANMAAAAFYGYSVKALQTMNFADVSLIRPEQLRRKLDQVRQRKRTYFQLKHQLASGEMRDVAVQAIPVTTGKLPLVYAIIHDITDQKFVEQHVQRANAELQQRLAELALLNNVTQILTSTLDFDTILQSITREMVDVFDADTCGIALLTSQKDALKVVAEYSRLNTESTVGLVLPLSENPFSVHIIETRRPDFLNIKDIHTETSVPDQVLQERRSYCLLISPLISRGEVIGTLGLDTATPDRKFSPAEIALIETVAGQAAGAIANARLFQQEQRQREIAQSLQEVTTVLNSSLDLQTVLKKILEQFSRIIKHDGAAIFLSQGDELILTAAAGNADIFLGARIPVTSANPGARVFRNTTALSIPDVTADPSWEVWSGTYIIRSWMGAPLMVDDTVLGVISADNLHPNAYQPEDQQILQIFANHAATAIRNAQQVKLVEDTLHETQLLYRVGSILAKSADIQQGIESAIGEFLQTLNVTQGGITLFTDDHQSAYLYVLYRNGQPAPMDEPINIRSKSNQYVIKTGVPLAIYDAFNDPLLIDSHDITIAHNIKSILLTPLVSRGNVIGLMGADSITEQRYFTDHEKSLAQAVADQIATALENTRLFEQEQHQRQMAESLREVAVILNSSLDHSEVLNKILTQLGRVINYDGAGILLRDNDQLILSGSAKLAADFAGTAIPFASQDPAARVVYSEKPIKIPDVHKDPGWKIWPGGELIRGWMGVPLVTSKGVIGALTVDSTKTGAYSQEDVAILQSFAHQAAIAIENARLFNELQAAKEEAEAASQAKSTFLASVSHELRTPLNGILGFTQILKMDPAATPQQLENLDVVEESAIHLLNLINEILDLAKIEAGKVELHPDNFQLAGFTDAICKIIRIRAEFKNLYFDCSQLSAANSNTKLPVTVRGDEIRLRQILINLLGNAIKFTSTGGVSLRIFRVDDKSDPANCVIRFEIEDTGRGIAQGDLDSIFDPFHQVGEQAQKVEGTGLGLTICRSLVQLMGGDLYVHSSLNQGSLFWFEIPLPEVSAETPAKPVEENQISGILGQPPKVLIVDDLAHNRMVISGLLSPLGCDIIEAVDGNEALAKAIEHNPDAIITELTLSGLSGLMLISQIRQNPILQDVKIIASSSNAFESAWQQSQAVGCDAFIPKPIRSAELFSALQKLLNLQWLYGNAPAMTKATNSLPLRLPPAPQLLELTHLARIGDVRKIRQILEELQAQDKAYNPFVDKINQLLKRFHLKEIRALLDTLQKNSGPPGAGG